MQIPTLTDRFGKEIYLGDKVESLTSSLGRTTKGDTFYCVYSIPQHRIGFVSEKRYFNYDGNWGFDVDNEFNVDDDCAFYLTPRNAKNVKVLLL